MQYVSVLTYENIHDNIQAILYSDVQCSIRALLLLQIVRSYVRVVHVYACVYVVDQCNNIAIYVFTYE